jgi:signal peptide peptidase SppA
MKRFPHIISKLFYEPVLITPAKHGAICQVVEAHMTGHLAATKDDKPEDYEDDLMMAGETMVIPIYGIIDQHIPDSPSGGGGCDLANVRQAVAMAKADPAINRVVFDFRTPGGTVTGVQETANRILELSADKETIAFTDSECCSAGIWLASQCEKFYSTTSASVGSVGVWCAYLDISRQMQNEGVNMQAFFAGKHKLMGAYWKPLTDDEKAIIQKSVDKIYAQFKTAMVAQREVSDEGFGNGLVFDGEEAAQLGFTDGTVDGLDEVLEMEVEPR